MIPCSSPTLTLLIAVLAPGTLCFGQEAAPPAETTQQGGRMLTARMQREVRRVVDLPYLLYLPAGYEAEPARKWPLILFLHGAGERGESGTIDQLRDLGPLGYARRHPDFPCIVVMPRCPLHQDWRPDDLMALLAEISEQYRVDADRIYLTGFSMGGSGTWQLAMHQWETFAAIAPLCGRNIPLLSGYLWLTPIWVFHGNQDEVVPFRFSQDMVSTLQGMGHKQVRFTAYEGQGHDIWTETYQNPDLYAWFLQHRLSDRQQPTPGEEH